MCLARKPWQVFTREVLLEQVWGYRHAADTRLVNVHVQRLRSKVEHDPENPEIVVTVRGVGYKAGNCLVTAALWPVDRLPEALRRGLTFWRRSIQARVVASTVLLSAVVVSAVGWFLLQQTRDGLLEHRVDAVGRRGQQRDRARPATRLEAASATDTAGAQKRELLEPIILRGEARGFGVVLAGPVGGTRRPDRRRGCDVDACAGHRQRPAFAGGALRPAGRHRLDLHRDHHRERRRRVDTEPGIVVGSQVALPADSRTYTLYYLFPLHEEQETLGLVSQALLTAAALLLVLVAGLTWLVTRQVVTPIRMARRVAERLAAGQLQQRLRVSGEDDLARLATSFNQMATSLQRQIRQLEELSRVQRRFVSDVSHELRTPLTTVRMAGDVLHDAREEFDPATARAAELLQTELDRFETLLVDLLEISRFDAGAAVLDTEDVNLVDVAHRVADTTKALADQRGTRLVVKAPQHPCLAEADVRRVERIVRNLVTNAIDHAESRRHRDPRRRRRPRGGDRRPRLRRRARAPASRPWCSTASGGPTRPARGPAVAPASGCRSRSRTPTCTAAGCRRGGGRARVPSSA